MSEDIELRLTRLEANVEQIFLLIKNLDDKCLQIKHDSEKGYLLNYESIDEVKDDIRDIKELLSNKVFRELI